MQSIARDFFCIWLALSISTVAAVTCGQRGGRWRGCTGGGEGEGEGGGGGGGGGAPCLLPSRC
jgi:hypothetical protein